MEAYYKVGQWSIGSKSDSANIWSIMATRIQMAQYKGCDGVSPDHIDVCDNENGPGLSQATTTDYLTYMAGGHTPDDCQ